jgi:HlyD family secretion protein
MAEEKAALPERFPALRKVAVPLAVIVVLALAALAAKVFTSLRPANVVEASGSIEATQSDLSPKVQGRLIALRVADGAPVKKGQVVAVLEKVDPTLDLDQARANAAAAKAQVNVAYAAYQLQEDQYETTLAQAKAGVSIAHSHLGQAGENLGIATDAAALSVDQAQAQLVAAQSAYAKAKIDLARARSLVGTGDEPQQTLDDASTAYTTAAAQLQAAHDALALALANRRNVRVSQFEVVASRQQQRQSFATLEDARAQERLVAQRRAQWVAARSQLAQAQAALGLAQNQVSETQLVAPFDGYVISHNFEVGDLIAPGAPVMTVGDLVHPYVYAYVSETQLPHVKAGMSAGVTIDGMPGRTFTGTVTEIGSTAEFTPENVQTKEERIEYLVFRVKIQLYDPTLTLKPGLPVDVRIHT